MYIEILRYVAPYTVVPVLKTKLCFCLPLDRSRYELSRLIPGSVNTSTYTRVLFLLFYFVNFLTVHCVLIFMFEINIFIDDTSWSHTRIHTHHTLDQTRASCILLYRKLFLTSYKNKKKKKKAKRALPVLRFCDTQLTTFEYTCTYLLDRNPFI